MGRTSFRLPSVLMGLANLPYGLWGGLMLVTVPQVLAARGVAEPVIASVTAAAMIPGFAGFFVSPILDVGLSRRSYAILFGLLTALFAYLSLQEIGDVALLTPLMIAGMLAAIMFFSALGGWLGAIVPKGEEGRLAASFTIGNVAGFGLGALLFISLFRALPTLAAPAAAAIVAAPLVLLALIPAESRSRLTARESFATLFRDLGLLLRQRLVLRTLLLFALPAASFALTNTLGGLGKDFHASEGFVTGVMSIGGVVAGLIGSTLIPFIIGRVPPLFLYLLVGGLGALFTLSFLGLPHTPLVFAIAVAGQNIFQSAAFVVENTIIFRSIGDANPLASTQFALLSSMTTLPIVYMQAVDGHAYGAGGLGGMFLADAGLSLIACALLLPLVLLWRRGDRVRTAALQPV